VSVDFQQVIELIEQGQRFVVTCHKRPDADALGSALGLAYVLREKGKEAVVYVPEALPLSVRFLGCADVVRELPQGATYDATFCMDTAAKVLVPDALPSEDVRGPLVVVDHHAAHDDVGDVVVRDIDACATGSVVMDLAEELEIPLPEASATPLYAALVADTGGFRYPSTQAKNLRQGAQLLELGADPWPVAYELFEGWPSERLGLLSAILDTLELALDGKLALLRVTRKMLEDLGATDDMVEGMVNYGRMLRGVQIAALLWEFPNDHDASKIEVKISLRSQGPADISKIAMALGGGGHRAAAGAQIEGTLDEVDAKVRDEAKKLLAELE